MNSTLFKATLRSNLTLGVFITLLMLVYVTTSVSMFDPKSAAALNNMLKVLPQGITKALGFDNLGTHLTGYLGHYLYGFIFIVFPLIYTVIVANKLIARQVDTGSMAYLLTTPNSRIRIATTQAVFLVVSQAVIFIITAGTAIVMSHSMFAGSLDVPKFLSLNLVTYLVTAAVGALAFFFSCIFNDSRYAIGLGGGLPLIFYLLRMIADLSNKLDWVRDLSVYSFIDVDRILSDGTFVLVSTLILLGISAALYFASITVFNRRSLPI